jgi:DNA-binding NarL/FixJ family response regulator
MIGAGRVVIVFQGVDPSLHAHVLGARLARSAAETLSGTDRSLARIIVGMADGDPGSDSNHLTWAAISAADGQARIATTERVAGDEQTDVVVLTRLATASGNAPIPEQPVLRPVDSGEAETSPRAARHVSLAVRMATAQIVVVDTAPPLPAIPGPAAAAVKSLVENTGIAVSGPHALPVSVERNVSMLVGSFTDDTVALLVVHPGNGDDNEKEHIETLERPAVLTRAFRQAGIRVLAVGVGASDITLAECLVHGAESAFSIGDLPDELSRALCKSTPDSPRAEPNSSSGSGSGDHSGQRTDRLAKLLLLTRSERRVLHHLTTGATAIEIADKLVLSLATVRSHIRSILRKLEVSSQLAAVAIAQGHSVRSPDSELDRGSRTTPQVGFASPSR